MKRGARLFVLLSLVALSACSNYAESKGEDSPQTETEISESTHDEQYGKTINISKSSYAYSEEGVYELRSLHPNSVNIVYTDFEKAQTLVLCGQPNCTHDSASCVSYIPIENGNLEPTIMCNNESLIIVKEGRPNRISLCCSSRFERIGASYNFNIQVESIFARRFFG